MSLVALSIDTMLASAKFAALGPTRTPEDKLPSIEEQCKELKVDDDVKMVLWLTSEMDAPTCETAHDVILRDLDLVKVGGTPGLSPEPET